eukprot:3594533-Rhodomonas_salina.2
MGRFEIQPNYSSCGCCGIFKGSLEGFHNFVFADGSTYEGEWIAGQPDGEGKYSWTSGTQCVLTPPFHAASPALALLPGTLPPAPSPRPATAAPKHFNLKRYHAKCLLLWSPSHNCTRHPQI